MMLRGLFRFLRDRLTLGRSEVVVPAPAAYAGFRRPDRARLLKAAIRGDVDAQLEVMRLFLYCAPGVHRNPGLALVWARRAFALRPNEETAHYATQYIPSIINTDSRQLEAGFGPSLEAANAGDVDAQSFLASECFAHARRTPGELDACSSFLSSFDFRGPAADSYRAALMWYGIAERHGLANAEQVQQEIINDIARRLNVLARTER
jgi:hypothetical protein